MFKIEKRDMRLNPEFRIQWPPWKLGFSIVSRDDKPSLGRNQRQSSELLTTILFYEQC